MTSAVLCRLAASLSLLLYALSTSAESAAQEVTPVPDVVNRVNVRELPSTQGTAIVASLAPGERATIIEAIANWYHVRLPSGVKGFVSKRWVELVTAPAIAGGVHFELHIVDVGNGDGILLDVGDKEILIDGGMFPTPLSNYLTTGALVDGPIELAVVTHADADHWKGMSAYLGLGQAVPAHTVLEFWEPGFDRGCSPLASYDDFIAAMRVLVPANGFARPLRAVHLPADQSGSAQPFQLPSIPELTITVLHADADPPGPSCAFKINNASIVLKFEIGGVSMLLTGDANGKTRDAPSSIAPGHVEAKLLALEAQHPGILKADVLKVGHHGSETANTDAFIAAVKPKFAIISASTPHHLPDPAVVRRYEEAGAIVLRTDSSREREDDPIICVGTGAGEIDCNYADEFE
jgi:beta-lactamase superfamily II metal-dependent hydrolase